jgi:bifunctional enzyme CysN/CysC
MQTLTRGATEQLSLVIVGHVDHGKSTLLGRLYADTGSLPDGKLERVQAICRQQGKDFEYAFLFDAFLEEQEQGITIDTARTFFEWEGRRYVVIDAPGHKEFLKNMVSGAARAEAALLVIDAQEGVQEQSRKHGLLLSLLGVGQVAVVVNKMDLVGYDEGEFSTIVEEFGDFLAQLGVHPERYIPASARFGDNVLNRGDRMSWYRGPTVAEALGLLRKATADDQQPLRFPVQDVYKFDDRRIISGRVAAGRLQVGDELVFVPSYKAARVRSIEAFNVEPPPADAVAGQSIGVTLDEQIFVERGEIAAHAGELPHVGVSLRCTLFWMGNRPLEVGRRYLLRLATREVECEIVRIERIVDATDLDALETAASVGRNEVAELIVHTRAPLAFDRYSDFEITGRFVLVDQYDVAGGGIIGEALPDDLPGLPHGFAAGSPEGIASGIGSHARGQGAALAILTGDVERASTLAQELESRLIADGHRSYVLDLASAERVLAAPLAGNPPFEVALRFAGLLRLLLDTGTIVILVVPAVSSSLRGAFNASLEDVAVMSAPVRAPTAAAPSAAPEIGTDAGTTTVTVEELVEDLRARGVLGEPPNG